MPEHGRIPSACPLITNWDPHEAGNLLRMGVETPQEVQPTRAQLPWFDIPTGSSGLAAEPIVSAGRTASAPTTATSTGSAGPHAASRERFTRQD